jgi:transposase-like protein
MSTPNTPIYKTIIDLVIKFDTEAKCHQYFASQRWSDGEIICPHTDCGHNQSYVFADGIRYKCKKCNVIFNAKTKTFMECSKLPSIKWILAMYLILHKRGISSVQLSNDIGVTQKTAWFMLQRIRTALGLDKTEVVLSGVVSADESFVGGKNKNRHHDKKVANSQGRSFIDKTPVLGLMQKEISVVIERPHKVVPGRTVKEKVITSNAVLKCWVISDTKAESIQPLVRANVKAGSIFISDEWHAYKGLGDTYQHEVVDHGRKQYVNDAGFSSNNVECAWSSLKRSIIGIYYKTSRKHLHKYVAEFEYRQNWRNFTIQQQIEGIILNMVCRLKYKDLITA